MYPTYPTNPPTQPPVFAPVPPSAPEPKKGTARKVIFYVLAGILALLALILPAFSALSCAVLALTAVILAKD